MNKLKFLKRNTYTTICNIDFNIVIYFDYDIEMLLYSLEVQNNNYSSVDYLIECATSLSDNKIDNAIKSFMLDYVKSSLNRFINENGYNDWGVVVYNDSFRLINIATKQHVEWFIYDYDEDYEVIQNEIIKFLKLQSKD